MILVKVRVGVFIPIEKPSLLQSYVIASPVAATENVAVSPAHFEIVTGWVVIATKVFMFN